MKKGLLIVLSGPSGTGKGTVCKALIAKRKDMLLSVSCTTRKQRFGEKDGASYFFVDNNKFDSMIGKDEFLEYANVFEHKYGTPKSFVEKALNDGNDVLLEIDVQGALKVKQKCPNAVYLFLVPPSMKELEKRIRSRATEPEAQIILRLGKAEDELQYIRKYDYVIVNDTVDNAVNRIQCIIEAEKMRSFRFDEKQLKF